MDIKAVSLKDYSSLNVGGEGSLVTVTDIKELEEALVYAKSKGLRVHVLGQGTNSYFGHDLSEFLFIKLDLKGVIFQQESQTTGCKLQVAASEIWDDVVALVVGKELRGVENLSYIPGTAGATPVQNIGAYGSELADTFVSCEVFDTTQNQVKILTKEDCHFGYRDSIFKHEVGKYIILSVVLLLSKERPFTLTYKPLDELASRENLSVGEVRDRVIEIRKSKLPEWRENPNCGSFFKNPVVIKTKSEELRGKYPNIPLIKHGENYKVPAGWLIEHVAHMKVAKVKGLRTWDKQSLVIVNDGDATADEVDTFVKEIKGKIENETGIVLEQEVNRIG